MPVANLGELGEKVFGRKRRRRRLQFARLPEGHSMAARGGDLSRLSEPDAPSEEAGASERRSASCSLENRERREKIH